MVGIVADEKRKRKVSELEGVKIAKSRNLSGYIDCNLKTEKNTKEVFEDLVRLMLACHGSGYGLGPQSIRSKTFLGAPTVGFHYAVCYNKNVIILDGDRHVIDVLNKKFTHDLEFTKLFTILNFKRKKLIKKELK